MEKHQRHKMWAASIYSTAKLNTVEGRNTLDAVAYEVAQQIGPTPDGVGGVTGLMCRDKLHTYLYSGTFSEPELDRFDEDHPVSLYHDKIAAALDQHLDNIVDTEEVSVLINYIHLADVGGEEEDENQRAAGTWRVVRNGGEQAHLDMPQSLVDLVHAIRGKGFATVIRPIKTRAKTHRNLDENHQIR